MAQAALSPSEMEAKALAQYAAMTGAKRDETIDYMRGISLGRWGTVSRSACAYAQRVLVAMGAA